MYLLTSVKRYDIKKLPYREAPSFRTGSFTSWCLRINHKSEFNRWRCEMRGSSFRRVCGIAVGLLLLVALTEFGDTATGATATPAPKGTTSATAAPGKFGGILRVGQDREPVGFDPVTSPAWSSQNMYELVFETMLRFDEKGQLAPGLIVK
jgi:hypothetical protein